MRILLVSFFLLATSSFLSSQVPFSCDGQLFLTLEPTEGVQVLVTVVIDPFTGMASFQSVSRNLGFIMNALGYRRTDNLLYGVQPASATGSNLFDLYQIDALGTVRVLRSLRLSTNYGYFGGDVTPDGRFLVLVGVPSPPALGPTELFFVDLEDPSFGASQVSMQSDFRIFDLAFDPITGDLYGFDSRGGNLLLINPINGNIITEFPSASNISQVVRLFFDAFGNIIAYAGEDDETNDMLFRVDKSTGIFTPFVAGEAAQNGDAASCPFTIDMIKSAEPREVVPCGDVLYFFDIANGTGLVQNGISFADQFPLGFTIVEVVANSFGGQLTIDPGANSFSIDNMSLPIGVERLAIRVNVGPAVPNIYNNQAQLINLPSEFGNSLVSDDPLTAIIDDSTSVLVLGVPEDSLLILTQICERESTMLDGRPYGNIWQWSTGETSEQIAISTEGTYTLEAIFGCDTTFVAFDVTSSDIQVDLPVEAIEIHVGDTVFLTPSDFFNTGNTTIVNWTNVGASIIVCDTCLETQALPFESTDFILQVTNEFGCTDDARIHVEVDQTRRVFGPNVFTPNGDGVNDFFFLQSPDVGRILNLNIYNRWGGVVFSTNNVDLNNELLGWNGRVNGMPVNPAVFVWVAEILFIFDVTGFEYGDITLLRNRP